MRQSPEQTNVHRSLTWHDALQVFARTHFHDAQILAAASYMPKECPRCCPRHSTVMPNLFVVNTQ